MSTTIKTNNQPRELKFLFEFSAKQQQYIRTQFDWVEDIEDDRCFFEYRGLIYHLSEFLRNNSDKDDVTYGWDGIAADSYFSGTLVRLCADSDYVVVGRYLA